MTFESEEEIRSFLRLCLNPGHGRETRTVEKLLEVMPTVLQARLEGHAPQLGTYRRAVERCERMVQQAKDEYRTALAEWISGGDEGAAPTPVSAPGHKESCRGADAPTP